MDIQSVAPEIIQDTESAPVPAAHDPNKSSTAPISIPVEEIDDTFSTSTIGKFLIFFIFGGEFSILVIVSEDGSFLVLFSSLIL